MHILDAKRAALIGSGMILALGTDSVRAGVTPGAAYSDITTSTGSTIDNGSGTTLGGTFIYTNMIADDLNLVSGGSVAQFTADIVNGNSTSVTFQPVYAFYSPNGTGGGPGTLLAEIFTPAITMSAGQDRHLTTTLAPGELVVPSGTLWAGQIFTNGTSSTTMAQLDLIGQGTFNPPDVGSSLDRYFLGSSTNAPFTGSNPSGTITNFGGSPVANFGWEIVVPEPSSVGVGAILLTGMSLRRRRRQI
jgi:hypothetical protein